MRRIEWPVFPLLCLTALSVWLLTVELDVRSAVAANDFGDTAVGFHRLTQQARLTQCDTALAPAAIAFVIASERQRIATACRQLAGSVLAANAWHGFAALVAASSAALQGDTRTRDAMLVRSAADAPFENWMAERRAQLALAAGMPPLASDLSTLLSTQSGAEFLARRYAGDAGLRQAISPVLDRLATDGIVRFANLLRRFEAE